MEVLKVDKENGIALVSVELEPMHCIYCEKLIDLDEAYEGECPHCGEVLYRLSNEYVSGIYMNSYPIIEGRMVEANANCIKTGNYIQFEIIDKKTAINVAIYKENQWIDVSHEDFKEFLQLPFTELLNLNYKKRGQKISKEQKHTLFYVKTLTFDCMLKLIKLKNMKALTRAFNNFLEKKYGRR